jgi:hypothetical protein
MLRLTPALALILAGCGSSWVFRATEAFEDPPPTDCQRSVFYKDVDGDGWGDPSGEFDELCEPSIELGFTASNGLDCVDDDALTTGEVGQMCPAEFHETTAWQGVVDASSELVVVHGNDTEVTRYTIADTICEAWGGQEYTAPEAEDGEGTYVVRGSLATFGSAEQRDSVQQAIFDSVTTDPKVYAGFIGLAWDDTTSDWTWVDDTDDAFIESGFDYCGDKPTLADVFPTLDTGNPEHAALFEQEKGRVRLALIMQDAGDTMEASTFCLGLPPSAIPENLESQIPTPFDQPEIPNPDTSDTDPFVADTSSADNRPVVSGVIRYYQNTEAHYICERTPIPDPSQYIQFVQTDEEGDTDE